MTTSPHAISPLRQRMIEDMRMRKLGDRTQDGYVRAVRYFAKYLGRAPDTATVEDLRNYQLYLVDHGTVNDSCDFPATLQRVVPTACVTYQASGMLRSFAQWLAPQLPLGA